jgi:hypothetical protein
MRSIALTLVVVALTSFRATPTPRPGGDEPKNLVASHLAGTWHVKADVTAMLGGPSTGELGEVIAFKEDATVEKRLAGKVADFIKSRGVFMAGVMTERSKDFPFALTQVSGSSYIFWFRERNGDPMGDSESFFVSLAAGDSKEKDLLFVGGDFDDQAFSAYGRSAPK